jgi:hypothetical protein
MRRSPPDLEPVRDLTPAAWVEEALRDMPVRPFRVRDLVPPVFEAYTRILHRPYRDVDGVTRTWKEVGADLGRRVSPDTSWHDMTRGAAERRWVSPFEGTLTEEEGRDLVPLLEGATGTPASCWFAYWSGWDFPEIRGHYYYARSWRSVMWERWHKGAGGSRTHRRRGRRRAFAIQGGAMSCILFQGDIWQVSRFHSGAEPRSPTLWWPGDRAWLVHTEIDATSTYLGGSNALVDQLVGEQILESFEVTEDSRAV